MKQAKVTYQTERSFSLPTGFEAGASYAGIKTYGAEPRLDVALLASRTPCSVGGIYTRNRIVGAPVEVTRSRVERGQLRALIANSGCSNVAMGEAGVAAAVEMAALAAQRLAVDPEQIGVASTGVIGRPLPLDKIRQGVAAIELNAEGGEAFARGIMTTDTIPKGRVSRFEWSGRSYTVTGIAKGSGMAHPDMATVFCFVMTDAPVSSEWLAGAVRRVGNDSLNMLDVDLDTSTSDMMLLLANGEAGGASFAQSSEALQVLEAALRAVAVDLTKDLARDGEGAKTLIEVRVSGALSPEEARRAARSVASSPLVKTMVTGRDPNLGRVLMALGKSGVDLSLDKLSVAVGGQPAFVKGIPSSVPHEQLSRAMDGEEVVIAAELAVGSASAVAWGCDLTTDYVHINADYTT